QTPGRVSLLEARPAIEHLAQPFVVDLDPAAPYQRQTVRSVEDRPELTLGQRLPIEGDFDGEVEDGVGADAFTRSLAQGDLYLGTRRPLRAPRRRHPHDQTSALHERHVGQKAMRLRGRPGERLEHGAS